MKKTKKIICGALLCMIGITSIPTQAATYTYTNSKGFTDAWQSANSGSDWTIVYGYNTSYINEDYTHTYHESKPHTASVVNGNGTYTQKKSSGNTAKCEVRHKGSSVSYKITY